MLLQIQFTTATILWLLACLILGLAYAFVLYKDKNSEKKSLNYLLFVIRTLAVTIIAYILFAPLVKSTTKTLEKPLLLIAQDNSASIGIIKSADFSSKSYADRFKKFEKYLSEKYEIHSYSFGNSVKAGLKFDFTDKQSNIESVFKMVNDEFPNRNIGAVILATDGIYNRGGNPQYASENLKAPIYTIALGDTIPKKDLLVSNINYNNIAYLDNQFQLEVSLEGYQCKGTITSVTVTDERGLVFTKAVNVNSNEFRQTIPITLIASKKGIRKYKVSIAGVKDELSELNNSQTIFVEVIDGKQNVLVIANSPHPDLSALKQTIEQNKRYSVKVVFPDGVLDEDIEKAGLVIMHQLPSLTSDAGAINYKIKLKPVLYIVGLQSSPGLFSKAQSVVNVVSSGNASQEILANVSADFYAFTISDSTKTKLQNFGPLINPFGNYAVKGASSILLKQQIGKVVTEMPLLVFGEESDKKIGILNGEGFWKWRLEEFQESGNHQAVNELINKTVQYLSSRNDKRKFRVYSLKNNFDENESVILNAELYNDAYELINSPDVLISIKDVSGKNYKYIFSKEGNAYKLDAGILPPGEYKYESNTQLGSKKYDARGQFVITQQQLELQRITANHQLLYTLAEQSGGKMIFPNQLAELENLLAKNENIKTLAYEESKYDEIIDLKVIFAIVLALLAVEWFIRKRNGEL